MKLSERLADPQTPRRRARQPDADVPADAEHAASDQTDGDGAGAATGGGGAPPDAAGGGRSSANATSRRKPATSNAERWTHTKRRVHEHVVAELGPMLAHADASVDLAVEVRSRLDDALRAAEVEITPSQRRKFIAEVTADILGYGPIEPFLSDSSVTEVMVNAYDDIYVEREGRLERTEASFTDEGQLRQVIDRIVASVGRRVDESSPLCDARLPDGSRVNVVLPPLALRGPALTVRKFPETPMGMDDLETNGTISPAARAFIEACVQSKLNILVTGGTGTGKTTMLNAASQLVPVGDRVVTIEDAAELQLHQPHVLPLEARPPNAEGEGEVTIRDLVRNALRMRPDRIVVGEVRGGEALDMLQAMNTGHEGSLTTLHANSPRDAFSRLETMVLMAGMDLTLRAIRDQIAGAIDVVVHLDRLGDGKRVVTAISEVQGMEGDVIVLQELFAYQFTAGGRQTSRSAGGLEPTGLRPKCLTTLQEAGASVSPSLFADPPAADGGSSPRSRR